MSWPGLYWMSEDIVYPSSVPSCPFWDAKLEAILSRSNFARVEVARCIIGEFCGVVQVVQYWFTESPNPSIVRG